MKAREMAGKAGRSGRPRKPTELLKLHGSYRKDRHGQRAQEPQPDGIPEQPDELDEDGRQHWERMVPGLVETGVATRADEPALVEMCHWWALLCKLRRNKAMPLEWKAMQSAAMASKRWLDIASRFGMTPADRAKIQVGPQEEHDPAANYIA